jgi:hypothetical protein
MQHFSEASPSPELVAAAGTPDAGLEWLSDMDSNHAFRCIRNCSYLPLVAFLCLNLYLFISDLPRNIKDFLALSGN